MTPHEPGFEHGPACVACGAVTLLSTDMIEFRGDEDRGHVLRASWCCASCGTSFEDDSLARRNAFAWIAASRLRRVASWLARHAALEGAAVLTTDDADAIRAA